MTRKSGKLHEYRLYFYSNFPFTQGWLFTLGKFSTLSIVAASKSAKKARQQQKHEQPQQKHKWDLASGKVQAVRQAMRDCVANVCRQQSDDKYKQDRENTRVQMSTSGKNQSEQKKIGWKGQGCCEKVSLSEETIRAKARSWKGKEFQLRTRRMTEGTIVGSPQTRMSRSSLLLVTILK